MRINNAPHLSYNIVHSYIAIKLSVTKANTLLFNYSYEIESS